MLGRLEFIGGGWSMNDEGAVHYSSVIDQMTWGFRRLHDAFGQCGVPRVAWHIDTFGHSREHANLFAQMNFDGFFFARIDHQDRATRIANKTLEFIWKGSDDLGPSADLFTGVLAVHYSPPPGFCWDLLCNDEPIIDDPESEDYNVDKVLKKFIKYSEDYASKYTTNNIMYTMGDDFQYQDANVWYKNLDKLIKYVREKYSDKVNIFYSTPSCYVKALNEVNKMYTTKNDDFFPYGSDPHNYWTGYFTSRPALKYYERKNNNFLHVCKQLNVLAGLTDQDKNIVPLKEVMVILLFLKFFSE